MSSTKQSRRTFLGSVTVGATGGLLVKPSFASPLSSSPGHLLDTSYLEYLFDDGITYLNTGTIGPCRRETIDASLKAWSDLESMPVKFYGGFGAEALAEKTRTIGARFLGCELDEIMITCSTTSGMNAVAQGLRLSSGDRVLISDQEHSGGLHCWKYFEKYFGVKIDTVLIPRGEFSGAAILEKFKKHDR